MRPGLLLLGLLLVPLAPVAAQQPADPDDLFIANIALRTETDAFGQTVTLARGTLTNTGDTPITDVVLLGEATDAAGAVVGEALGYLVNACGEAVPPTFALAPGASQGFAAPVELYQPDTAADAATFTAQATVAEATPEPAPLADGVRAAFAGEVVRVEWQTESQLLFATGCTRDVFTAWNWQRANAAGGTPRPTPHPLAARITDTMRTQLQLSDDTIYNRSFLSFPPRDTGRRLVYQDTLNNLFTAEPDGSYRRLIDNALYTRTLQDIYWLDGPGGARFVASYYGAYGEPVTYLVANEGGAYMSVREEFSDPSITRPGASPDGQTLVIGLAPEGGESGYYVKASTSEGEELLFPFAPLPGNNFPAPAYDPDEATGDRVYVALPTDDGGARLACFNRTSATLTDLAPLPIRLSTEERAWMWLSPERTQLALAANGVNGGLWIVNLAALPACS